MRMERALVGVLLLATTACVGAPGGAGTSSRVLPPEGADFARGVLGAQALAGVKLDRLVADPGRVEAWLQVDGVPGTLELRLSDPAAGCTGRIAGAWCVSWPAGRAPPAVADRVAAAFGDAGGGDLWQVDSRRPAGADRSGPAGRAVPLALAVLLGPALFGATAGRLARRLPRGGRWVATGTAAIALIVLPFVAPPPPMPLGFWDALWAGVTAAAAMVGAVLAGARRPSWADVALAATMTVAALAALELASRVLWPSSPMVFAESGVVSRGEPGHDGWDGPLPDNALLFVARTGDLRDGPVRVLHVGDSMVFGAGVEPDEAFPAVLGRLEPGVVHVNGGVNGTGPDYYYLLARSFLKGAGFQHVVVYLFPGNDLGDLDREYPACGGPLLAYGPNGPLPRCELGDIDPPRWGDPPPYPMRVAARGSALVRHAWALWTGRRGVERPALTHLREVLRAMRQDVRAHGAELTAVLLPLRHDVEVAAGRVAPGPTAATEALREQFAEAVRQAGVLLLDPWDLVVDAVARDGSERWFAEQVPGDPHLSAEGHDLLARWLHERLPALPPAETNPGANPADSIMIPR